MLETVPPICPLGFACRFANSVYGCKIVHPKRDQFWSCAFWNKKCHFCFCLPYVVEWQKAKIARNLAFWGVGKKRGFRQTWFEHLLFLMISKRGIFGAQNCFGHFGGFGVFSKTKCCKNRWNCECWEAPKMGLVGMGVEKGCHYLW